MRRLLKIIDNLARLIAVVDIGKQICEHLASKKQPTIQKRRTAKQLINNHPAVLVAIPSGPFFLQFITETYTTTSYLSAIYNISNV